MMEKKALIIIPTYNESTNIVRMIDRVMVLDFPLDVLIVDDGSPDGTAENVKIKQKEYPNRVHLIERESKQGLGTAYVRGFEFALNDTYEYILEMDATPIDAELISSYVGDVIQNYRK